MASKQLTFTQPASQEQPGSESPRDVESEKSVSGSAAEPKVAEDGRPLNPDVSALIKVIEHLAVESKPGPSKLYTISNNPLVVVIVGGFIGALLTHVYTLQQKEIDHTRSIQQLELASQRSFTDELNKIRIQKIGEVWEQIDKNEVTLDELLDKANKSSGSNKEIFDTINKVINEDLAVINKNRFWLGEPAYDHFKMYLDITGRYVVDKLLGHPGIDLSETLSQREQAKKDILHMRSMFLKGETAEPGK